MKRMWDKYNFQEALDKEFAAVAESKDYYPVEEIEYTNASDSITIISLKCVKIGNVAFATIRFNNSSGATIAAGTELFKLGITIPETVYVMGYHNGSVSTFTFKENSYFAMTTGIASGATCMCSCMIPLY